MAKRKKSKSSNSSSPKTAYCVRCKTKRSISGAKRVQMRNGRFRLAGNCSSCGTKVSRML